MKVDREYHPQRCSTVITAELTDRDFAAAVNPRAVLEQAANILAHRLADIVWAKLEPAVVASLNETMDMMTPATNAKVADAGDKAPWEA